MMPEPRDHVDAIVAEWQRACPSVEASPIGITGRVTRIALLLVSVMLLAGCGVATHTIDQRTTQGPTADEFWMTSMLTANGRYPSFEEKRHFMDELDGAYPGYGFARHKGYGTDAHLTALGRLGPSLLHRSAFLPVVQAALFEWR